VYDDQFYVAAAMHDGKLGSKINEHPTTIIAKDEYFRDEQGRAFMESMNALPAYRYKDHGQLGLVGRAGAALIEACTHRLVRGDNLVIFGEGERNITGDPTRVQ
jgi:1-acyl-sn-glycerol-3-phosphate acyltransferase